MKASEESWRRTDPELFLLPEDEMLNFAGNPVAQTLGKTLVPWKVTFSTQAEMESYFPLVSKYIGQTGIEILKNEIPRLIFVYKTSALVRVFVSESLQSSVEFQSSPWEPESTAPHSKIGLLLSKRLKICAPHELVITMTSKGNEVPFVVVCDEIDPDFAQSFSKIKFILAKNSKAHLVLLEGGSPFSIHNHQICLEENADLTHVLGYRNENSFNNLLERNVTLKENSKFCDAQILTCSKGNVRLTSNITLNGIRSVSESGSVVVASGGKFHYEPIQHHKAQQTKSNFKLKMLLSNRSRGIFEGLVVVDRDAQKSNAIQENKNLLLSPNARVDATPRLEILPNDVSCKHGSATSELDSKQLYYLTSRGFSEDQAKQLLIHSFASEVLSKLESEACMSLYTLAQSMLDVAFSHAIS